MSYAGEAGKGGGSSYFDSPSALTNAGINAISFFAPPGYGMLADFAHSAYNSYAYPGQTSQSIPGHGFTGRMRSSPRARSRSR